MKRALRIVATLVVLTAASGYILRKIDVHETARLISGAQPRWMALAASLILAMTLPMAWRWQLLLRTRGIHESLAWLGRAYFVSFAVAQVLPTSVGGDAARIYETARRHQGQTSALAGAVLVERAVGGVVTLTIAAIGLALAVGRYPIGAYLWIEAMLVVGAAVLGVMFFSRGVRLWLVHIVPLARRLGVERIARGVYRGVHGYRSEPATLGIVFLATLVVQVMAICAIYASGRAVGADVSPLAYVVLGPLLFLVTLVPFTINGLGVREAFFVSFLGNLGVAPEAAFACGFLFFVMTVIPALGGVVIMIWEAVVRPLVVDGSSAR